MLYIVNPVAYGGAGMEMWEEVRALWPDPIDSADVIVTERPGHAREIAAARGDYEILAAVGGDGTAGEVMSGIMARRGTKSKVAIIPCGTGNDIGRDAGVLSVADTVAALRDGHTRVFDLIRIDYRKNGAREQGYAFVYGCAGFSTTLVRSWMKRLLGPRGAYYLASLLEVFLYRAPHMTVRTEDREYKGRNFIVIVGNAEWGGGGSMCLAPGALTDDGKLNITIVPSLSKIKIVTKMFTKFPIGAHIDEPGVSYFTGKKVEVHSDPPAIVEFGGDAVGTTPATFTVCPRAVEMICPAKPDRNTAENVDATSTSKAEPLICDVSNVR